MRFGATLLLSKKNEKRRSLRVKDNRKAIMGVPRWCLYIDILSKDGSTPKQCFRAFVRFILKKAKEENPDEVFKGNVPGNDATIKELTQFLEKNMRHTEIRKCFRDNPFGGNGRMDLLYPKIKTNDFLKKWFEKYMSFDLRARHDVFLPEKRA